MPDHHVFGLPREKMSGHRISVIIRRDVNPVAGLEADALSFQRPILQLARLRLLCDLNRLLRRHVGYAAVPNRSNSIIPGPYRRYWQERLDLRPTVLPCEPDGMVGG